MYIVFKESVGTLPLTRAMVLNTHEPVWQVLSIPITADPKKHDSRESVEARSTTIGV